MSVRKKEVPHTSVSYLPVSRCKSDFPPQTSVRSQRPDDVIGRPVQMQKYSEKSLTNSGVERSIKRSKESNQKKSADEQTFSDQL